jgi:predicted HTH transcriptional regulator
MPVPFVLRYIEEGEHQQQDFKMRVDDARKIARTLVAFANTDGGRLLIGVKDNGQVSGVRVEEEMYVLEGAAQRYCQPPVQFEMNVWKVEHKSVLDVWIAPSPQRPHKAELEPGSWKCFIRRDDQNLPAPAVLLEVWKTHDLDRSERYFHTDKEKQIFEALQDGIGTTFAQLMKKTGLQKAVLVKLLARFIRWQLIELYFINDQAMYRLKL